ncbi:hypothetical protein RHS04_08912 [Rhizoctonia solani]|uniref:Transmembrane protein n=1 Tax=Rhizoctonia solani TaxID=456999 RepID=A0A8H7H0V8_9AGAM|nr:hypothetical protein RHS04_08912 [Rhizoctonia solani]
MKTPKTTYMGPRDLKPSDTPFDLISVPLFYQNTYPEDEGKDIAKKKLPQVAWVSTLLPLAMHFIISTGIALMVLCYVSNRPFNTIHRRPYVRTIDGQLPTSFSLTQSDVVALLSTLIVVQKWALMGWVVPLCWSIAIILMEKYGLYRRDLKTLVKYRVLAPRTYFASTPTFVIGTLLLASLAANSISPLLTGSIVWDPQNTPIRHLSTAPIPFLSAENESGDVIPGSFMDLYMSSDTLRQDVARWGSGLVGIAWKREPEKGVLKVVSKLVETLAINSTVETVTLPYFAIHSVEWIRNENDLPAYARNIRPEEAMQQSLNLSPGGAVTIFTGASILVPDLSNPTNWSNDPWVSRTIEGKRLLIHSVGSMDEFKYMSTRGLPPGAYLYVDKVTEEPFAFAWVTFSAGVGKCKNYQCIVSSSSTIQSDARISLEPHPFTFQALEMAATVSAALVYQNTSIPYPWENFDDYIEALLVRSYSAAWNAISNVMSASQTASGYYPALPGLVAKVDHARVFWWLGLQISVTLLSVVFLVLHRNISSFPLLGDVTLVAFYLDTTSLPESGSPYTSLHGELKVDDEDKQLKVRLIQDRDTDA